MNAKQNNRHPFWLLGLAGLLTCVAGAGWYCKDGLPGAASAASTATGSRGPICSGKVDVEPCVAFVRPAQSGRVAEILVAENQEVEAGSVLFRLEGDQARYLVRAAEAAVKAAEAQLAKACAYREQHRAQLRQQRLAVAAAGHRLAQARHLAARKRDLLNMAVNEREVLAAEEQVKEADASVRAARERLRELGLNDPGQEVTQAEANLAGKQALLAQAQHALRECEVRAPYAGKVLEVQLGLGDATGPYPSAPAVVFCPGGPRIIRAEVDQEFAGEVRVGQRAFIRDETRPGPARIGTVIRVADWYTHQRSALPQPGQLGDVSRLQFIVRLDPDVPPPPVYQRVQIELGRAPD